MKNKDTPENLYFDVYPVDFPIPAISEIIETNNKLFIEHVTLNSPDLNKETYNLLNAANYRSFMYAFAYELGKINPEWKRTCEFFKLNAQNLNYFLYQNLIAISETEKEVLYHASNFTKLQYKGNYRSGLSTELQIKLCYEYGII